MGAASACAPSLSDLRKEIPPDKTQFDLALLDGDPQGRLVVIRRLCQPLASPAQQRLGFHLARRAAEQSNPSKSAVQQTPAFAENLELARCAALIAADAETPPGEQLAFLEEGIAAAQKAGSEAVLAGTCAAPSTDSTSARAPDPPSVSPCGENTARAAYVHAVLAGQKMRLAGMTEALRLLGDELALLNAAQAVPDEDMGGPLRLLGFIYLKAPAWPAGPGDLDRSLELLQTAVKRHPSHPLNHLFLAAVLNEDGDREAAAAEIALGLKLADERLWGRQAIQWRDLDALTAVR